MIRKVFTVCLDSKGNGLAPPARVPLRTGMRTPGRQPRIRTARAGLAFGAVALVAFPLQVAALVYTGVIGWSPGTADPPAALPLERTANGAAPRTGRGAVVIDAAADGTSTREAVRDVWTQVDAAWNARDAQAFSRHFAEDVSFRFVRRGQSLDGRATLLEHFGEQFPRYAPELRHRTRIDAVRGVAPGVSTAEGEVRIVRPAADVEEPPVVLRTFAIFAVMSASGEAWTIRALRVYELPAAAADAD